MWLLGLAACWWFPPASTSTQGMTGTLHTSDGEPLVGHLVETVESTVQTDAEGRFGLHYKRPDTHVHFVHDGTWYRRRYVEADEGTSVRLQLPETHPLTVGCAGFTCDVELRWSLGPGFSGKQRVKCVGGDVSVERVPVGQPEVTCRETGGGKLDVRGEVVGDRLELGAPPRDLTVAVSLDNASVSGCELSVGDQRAPSGGQSVKLTVAGAGLAHGVCNGRPAWPTPFGPTDTEVEVRWTPDGPELQPPPGMEFDHLELRWADGQLVGRSNAEGRFLLPPLPPGLYELQLHSGEAAVEPPELPKPERTGVVVGRRLASGVFVGRLSLDAPLPEGVVELSVEDEP